jgi:hypothetical protein
VNRDRYLAIFGAALLLFIILLAFECGGQIKAADTRAAPVPIRRAICRVFENCRMATRVAWCESRLEPWAWSGADAGLFQANYQAHHRPGESVREFRVRHADIRYHVGWAYRLSSSGRDWTHWRWSRWCWS